MASIALDRAYLTAIWLETLFYGINLSLFVSYMAITKFKRRGRPMHKLIVITAILMFLLSTTHVSLGFYRLIEGFIVLRDEAGGPGAFFSDVSIPANVAKVTIHTINSVLGDSIMVWRCFHVWSRSWRMSMAPILLIIASAVCGFGQSVIFANGKTIHTAFQSQLARWNGSVFTLSLVTNVVVTVLIGCRIWYLSRQYADMNLPTTLKYRRILLIVVESGAVYSSALIIEITLYFLDNNAFYIIYDPIAQLTAIVPTTIIVLTSLGLTSNDLATQETKRASHALESRPQFAVGAGRRGRMNTMSLFTSTVPHDENDENTNSLSTNQPFSQDSDKKIALGQLHSQSNSQLDSDLEKGKAREMDRRVRMEMR
ncbi:hypothetical protein K435DRAFT_964962 [Dendrothele bispora CBS 962.96]|uniref:Uncharacterized protein n=1 Tax=Dendrothele bispora (strain CBS 962.96) TaxID=1314807 RepID=A0A4V4HGD8_DENBC|nr:hypothetical protein K435DRAFT_964962 [Dendrothele bispora CBS 962.96]